MASALISVFLPTFRRNESGSLLRSVNSLICQDYKDFEAFIVDDGSTDGTAEALQRFCASDSRLNHVRIEENVGLPALTTGLAYRACNGEFVAFAFDDCFLMPEHLTILSQALHLSPRSAMAYGKARTHWPNGQSSIIGKPYSQKQMDEGNNHIPNVSAMIRREALEVVGWYDPHVLLKRFCDWDLWRRLAVIAEPLFVDAILADEFGTAFSDSLGETCSLLPDLMMRYSRTFRNDILHPDRLQDYDPFRKDFFEDFNDRDISDIDFLILEHLILKSDVARAELFFSKPFFQLEIEYLRRRVRILSAERNRFQQALFEFINN